MTIQKPKLLITGINGTIGRTIHEPLSDSYDIYGLDLCEPFSNRVFESDISDFDQVLEIMRSLKPLPYVIHLAAESNATANWNSVLKPNIIGTRNVYEASKDVGVKRIIFASSNHVTGAYEGFAPHLHLHLHQEPEKVRISDPIRPDGDYGVSKAFGEAMARYYCARWGIESICLRIGTVRDDDDPTSDARVMKTWLSKIDLIHLIEKSLVANVSFGIYYGVSNNLGAFWDISNARTDLDYSPKDNASKFLIAKNMD
jgi:nucleoside-diphosphate-sugar epimerase